MPTALYTDPTSLFAPAFEFDSTLQWEETHEYETTDRKIESKGSISDYIASKPMNATLEGRVTATQIDAKTLKPQKLVGARDALVQLANRRQLVLVVSELFTGELAIVGASISKSADDGKSFKASIKLKRMEFTQTASAAVPTAALKKKITKTAKKGGAAAKRPATAGEKKKGKTLALNLATRAGIKL